MVKNGEYYRAMFFMGEPTLQDPTNPYAYKTLRSLQDPTDPYKVK